ncbi:MAG: hypothetical protein WAR22_07135 [Desulfomonilia bacterium]
MRKRGGFLFVAAVFIMLAFAGCSDSSSSSDSGGQGSPPTAPAVSGIASSGAAIDGTVTLKDISGEELGPQDIGPDGSFSFDVTGLTPPFVIRATDGARSWYSCSPGPGTANVNPLTTLVLAMAAQTGNPAALYGNPAQITDDAISSALEDIQAFFANLFSGFGLDAGFAPFTGDCTVNHDGIDALFDALEIGISPDGNLSVTRKATGEVLVNTPITGINPDEPLEDTVTALLLWGTYNYCHLSFDTPAATSKAIAGSLTFAADGSWTAVEEASSSGDTGDERGEYTMAGPGYFMLSAEPDGPGFMTFDREIAVVTDMIDDGNVGLTVLCRRDSSLSVSDISGTYLSMNLNRAGSEISVVTFDGAGRFVAGTEEEQRTGTYAIDPDTCRLTLTVMDDEIDEEITSFAMTAKAGDVIVAPEFSAPDEVGISIFVRISSKDGWGASSLDGSYYYLSEISSRRNASPGDMAYASIGMLWFNGGFIEALFSYSDRGTEPVSAFPYAVLDYHDELQLAFDHFLVDETDLGIATPDGEFFILMDDGDPEEAGISLGIKTQPFF